MKTTDAPVFPYRSVGIGMIVMLFMLAAVPSTLLAEEQDWRQRPSVSEPNVGKEDVQAEIAFGREVAARLLGRYRKYENEALMKYVTLVGRSLTMNSSRPEIEYHFVVVDTPEINAYAAPGGYVFVTKGAISQMKDEAELAGVLAHEITHVSEKHIVKELNIQGTEDSPAAGFARLVGGSSDSARVAFAQAVDKAIDMLFKDGYKREDETRADKGAALLCALSGYDASALARYLERIGAVKGKQTEVLDKTHPAYSARVALLKETIANEGIDIASLKTNKERFAAAVKGMK